MKAKDKEGDTYWVVLHVFFASWYCHPLHRCTQFFVPFNRVEIVRFPHVAQLTLIRLKAMLQPDVGILRHPVRVLMVTANGWAPEHVVAFLVLSFLFWLPIPCTGFPLDYYLFFLDLSLLELYLGMPNNTSKCVRFHGSSEIFQLSIFNNVIELVKSVDFFFDALYLLLFARLDSIQRYMDPLLNVFRYVNRFSLK